MDFKDLLAPFSYLLNFIIENLMLPGQIENWNIMMDFGETGFKKSTLDVNCHPFNNFSYSISYWTSFSAISDADSTK